MKARAFTLGMLACALLLAGGITQETRAQAEWCIKNTTNDVIHLVIRYYGGTPDEHVWLAPGETRCWPLCAGCPAVMDVCFDNGTCVSPGGGCGDVNDDVQFCWTDPDLLVLFY